MDFLSFVEQQREKLDSQEYINAIWNLINNYEAPEEPRATVRQEYRYHLPIDMKDFLQSCVEKIENLQANKEELILSEQLRIYLLTFIYWCLFTEENCEIHILASQLYIDLLCFPDNICFKSVLYKKVISELKENLDADELSPVLRQLRKFLNIQELETEFKEITLNLLITILQNKSSTVINSFDIETTPRYLDHEALLCIKVAALKEKANIGLFVICMHLLTGIRSVGSNQMTRQSWSIMQGNLKNLIKDLHEIILYGSYAALKNALVYCWSQPDFEDYNATVSIMNDMDVENYQSLVEKLRNLIISKDDLSKKNLIHLSYAIMLNPSQHYTNDKLDVLFQTLIRSIIMNSGSSNPDVCNVAIEVTASMCSAKNIKIDKNMKIVLNSEVNMIHKDAFIKRLNALVDQKWKNKSKNKNICIILCYLMNHFEVDEQLCVQTLKILVEEATPFDLKSCALILLAIYVKMKTREKDVIAQAIFNVLYKMSMHPAATSSEFLKHVYGSMIYPVKFDGQSFSSDIFITPLITEDYNFDEFFKKCDSLSMIKPEHVKKIIYQLNTSNDSQLKLLCAMLEYVNYTDYMTLTKFILDNFEVLVDQINSKYVFFALNKILSKRRGPNANLAHCEILLCLKDILELAFREQKYPSKVISNVLSLLKTIIQLTNCDMGSISEECEQHLYNTLMNVESDVVDLKSILYAAELTLLVDYLPSVSSRNKLESILRSFSKSSSIDNDRKYDIWTFCLILQTAIAMKHRDSVHSTLFYLKYGIKSKNDVVKLTSIRLLYDISDVILRNFENLTEILFTELSGDSLTIKKTCIGYIEKLVRDEYLRLNTNQYLKFICLLRESDGMSEYMKNLLQENFIMSNQSTIARNFVSLIVHFNQYQKHPVIKVDKSVLQAVRKTNQTVKDKEDMYTFLIKPLTKKSQFNVLKEISTLILENVIEENLRYDIGFWEMLHDSLLVTKIVSLETYHSISEERYYSKIVHLIDKNINEKNKHFADKPKYVEFQTEIKEITLTLLKLLFVNESHHFLTRVKFPLFAAIIYWTSWLLPDIVHLVHEENCKRMSILYSKIPAFYRKEIQGARNEQS